MISAELMDQLVVVVVEYSKTEERGGKIDNIKYSSMYDFILYGEWVVVSR